MSLASGRTVDCANVVSFAVVGVRQDISARVVPVSGYADWAEHLSRSSIVHSEYGATAWNCRPLAVRCARSARVGEQQFKI